MAAITTLPPAVGRVSYLRVDQMRMLDHWAVTLQHTFDQTPYLVGSAITSPNYRDVDIRIPLSDEAIVAIPMRLRDFNMLLSRWGQDVTGLPIDCQVQSATEFNKHTGIAYPRGLI